MTSQRPIVLPQQVELTPQFVKIEWADGHVSLFGHRYLRGNCRCAACVNEMSGVRRVGFNEVAPDVVALDWMQVGRYALQFLWSDGHDTGIYPFTALRDELCPCEDCRLRREAAGRGVKSE